MSGLPRRSRGEHDGRHPARQAPRTTTEPHPPHVAGNRELHPVGRLKIFPAIAIPTGIADTAIMIVGVFTGDPRAFILGWLGAVLCGFGYLQYREDQEGPLM